MEIKVQLIAFYYNTIGSNDLQFCVFTTKTGIINSGTVSSPNWYENDLGIKHIPINDNSKYYFELTINNYNKLFGVDNWEIVDWGNLFEINQNFKYQAIIKLDKNYQQYFDSSFFVKEQIPKLGDFDLHTLYGELSKRRKFLEESIDDFKYIKIHEIDLMLVRIGQLLLIKI